MIVLIHAVLANYDQVRGKILHGDADLNGKCVVFMDLSKPKFQGQIL